MKLLTLFILSLVFTVNVSANEHDAKNDAVQVQPSSAFSDDAGKESAEKVLEESRHQHDSLKTQFLGKRPYMEKIRQ
jgi:hypothetical protein